LCLTLRISAAAIRNSIGGGRRAPSNGHVVVVYTGKTG